MDAAPWHTHIEDHDVRPMPLSERDRFPGIAGQPYQTKLRGCHDDLLESCAERAVVVCDHHRNDAVARRNARGLRDAHRHCSTSSCHGNVEVTSTKRTASLQMTLRPRGHPRRAGPKPPDPELESARDAFLDAVSAEILTPLTLMLGPLRESLADDRLPPEERHRVAMAHRAALPLLNLVDILAGMAWLALR